MSVYLRGRVYWIEYLVEGRRVRESTRQADRRTAVRIEREQRRRAREGRWRPLFEGATAPTTADYAPTWLARLEARGVRTARDYRQRYRDHVEPDPIASMPLVDVRPRHVIDFVGRLRARMDDGELAPRTLHHVYDVFRSICRDAVIDEIIPSSPCVLPPRTLPPKRDQNPKWRARAVFTPDEVSRLISPCREVPPDRRMVYGLLFLTGMRFGEAAGRRWEDYDAAAEPLGRLLVATQYEDRPLKTDQMREVPVHPVLAAMLAEWRLEGFPRFFGRPAAPGDWVVPSRRGRCRTVRLSHRRLVEDLEALGLRPRRQHDARRTFITMARAGGARDAVLKAITHGAQGDVTSAYTTWPWETLCEAVRAVDVRRGGGGPSVVAATVSMGSGKPKRIG